MDPREMPADDPDMASAESADALSEQQSAEDVDAEQQDTADSPAGETSPDESSEGESPAEQPTAKKRKRRVRTTRINRLVMAFQPDVVELENRPVPGKARWTLYTVTLLLAGAVAWACWAQVDRIVVAPGKLITTEAPIVIQPVTLSPIKHIYKRFGDIVEAGEKLAELDPTFAEAEYAQGILLDKSLRAQITRLEAERDHVDYVVDLQNSTPAELNEYKIFVDKQTEYKAKILDLNAQIRVLETKIDNNKLAQKNYKELVQVHEQKREKSKEAYLKGAISESTLLDESIQRISAETQYKDTVNQLRELEDELTSTKNKVDTFKAEWNTKITAELVEAKQKLSQNEQALTKTLRMKDLIDLRVPSDLGTKRFMIMEVADRSVGSVLREGEPLFKLMPLDVELEVEVDIPGKDVARIREGDSARVKLDSFPYQKHGTLDGEVIKINESSIEKGEPPNQQSVYQARIKLLNPNGLEGTPKDALMPGMTTIAEIKVGKRRVIEYFLYPLLRNLDSSIREP